MGLLIEGQWHDQWYDTEASDGKFVRESARFRNWVTADGSAGPSGKDGFKAEPGRYHLYVSLACPWAHRTLIMRALKGLEELVSVSVVSPIMLEDGWTYDRLTGSSGDSLGDRQSHHQVYTDAVSDYIRMFNTAFDGLTGNSEDFYPRELREGIDAWNERIYDAINNGVYRAGFATAQAAYEEAYAELFRELDALDMHLDDKRYLMDDVLTEADIRLFTTLIRFDAVYHGHFKCNRQRLEDYRHLPAYVRHIYQLPGVAETVDFDHIKRHYYASHKTINPTGVVPLGPDIDYAQPQTLG
jgi:putative glutathione S-transferase